MSKWLATPCLSDMLHHVKMSCYTMLKWHATPCQSDLLHHVKVTCYTMSKWLATPCLSDMVHHVKMSCYTMLKWHATPCDNWYTMLKWHATPCHCGLLKRTKVTRCIMPKWPTAPCHLTCCIPMSQRHTTAYHNYWHTTCQGVTVTCQIMLFWQAAPRHPR